jgi:signal peptidase I
MGDVRFILWRDQDRAYLGLLAVLAAVFTAVVLVFFVVFTAVRVEGDSMEPVLLPDDRVLVTRAYVDPRRGDIVAADMQTETGQEGVIKRVVALPGDEVVVEGDLIYVNGALSDAAPQAIVVARGPRSRPMIVPPDHVYLAGDNRPISYDSRFAGPVPLEAVTGRVVAVFSPATRWRLIPPGAPDAPAPADPTTRR